MSHFESNATNTSNHYSPFGSSAAQVEAIFQETYSNLISPPPTMTVTRGTLVFDFCSSTMTSDHGILSLLLAKHKTVAAAPNNNQQQQDRKDFFNVLQAFSQHHPPLRQLLVDEENRFLLEEILDIANSDEKDGEDALKILGDIFSSVEMVACTQLYTEFETRLNNLLINCIFDYCRGGGSSSSDVLSLHKTNRAKEACFISSNLAAQGYENVVTEGLMKSGVIAMNLHALRHAPHVIVQREAAWTLKNATSDIASTSTMIDLVAFGAIEAICYGVLLLNSGTPDVKLCDLVLESLEAILKAGWAVEAVDDDRRKNNKNKNQNRNPFISQCRAVSNLKEVLESFRFRTVHANSVYETLFSSDGPVPSSRNLEEETENNDKNSKKTLEELFTEISKSNPSSHRAELVRSTLAVYSHNEVLQLLSFIILSLEDDEKEEGRDVVVSESHSIHHYLDVLQSFVQYSQDFRAKLTMMKSRLIMKTAEEEENTKTQRQFLLLRCIYEKSATSLPALKIVGDMISSSTPSFSEEFITTIYPEFMNILHDSISEYLRSNCDDDEEEEENESEKEEEKEKEEKNNVCARAQEACLICSNFVSGLESTMNKFFEFGLVKLNIDVILKATSSLSIMIKNSDSKEKGTNMNMKLAVEAMWTVSNVCAQLFVSTTTKPVQQRAQTLVHEYGVLDAIAQLLSLLGSGTSVVKDRRRVCEITLESLQTLLRIGDSLLTTSSNNDNTSATTTNTNDDNDDANWKKRKGKNPFLLSMSVENRELLIKSITKLEDNLSQESGFLVNSTASSILETWFS